MRAARFFHGTWVALACAVWTGPLRAQPAAPPPVDATTLEGLDLESLLNVRVVSSTKTEQSLAQAPAVITVITGEEIRQRGYTCLADVLRTVPGFYDVNDLVTHNLGIRGVNGGVRAGGNVLKLMIDGHPVDFRPTTENFFGEELIPLEAIERVEIIRGPGSALYGLNAFLGVVNVITRSAAEGARVETAARGYLMRGRPGGGASAAFTARSGPVSFLVAGSLYSLDRSGLDLPATSPVLSRTGSDVAQRGASQNDRARPRSLLLRASHEDVMGGTLSALGSVQQLDSAGEFQDFGPLSHGTRVSLLNQAWRMQYQRSFADLLHFTGAGFYTNGAPTPDNRWDIGRRDYVLVRQLGVQGWGAAFEGRFVPVAAFSLTLGADLWSEDHLVQTFNQRLTQDVLGPDGSVIRSVGTVLPGEKHDEHRQFQNLGVFAQALVNIGRGFSAVFGARLDNQNIYGAFLSSRAGLVYAPPDTPLSVKLLYGSSFKAPTPTQLYAQPYGFGDIQGNPDLRPQKAHTVEVSTTVALPAGHGEVSANVFLTGIEGRVEFLQSGLFLRAANIAQELVLGGEVTARFVLTRSLHVRVQGGFARTIQQDTGGAFTGHTEVRNQLFPPLQVHLVADYLFGTSGLRVSGESSYVAERNSSQSNALQAGAPYSLPPYLTASAVVSWTSQRVLPGRDTRLLARVNNLFDRRWTDPGYNGVDFPSSGMEAIAGVSQEF